jgi:hypothetical protein
MHTFLKRSDDRYEIGQWLLSHSGTGQTFVTLFTVPNLKQAFVAVNALNGGTRISPEALKIIETDE